ncbi:glutaminyl-peptide cyclotransferase [Sphingomonas sp. PB4P5]|uniref:glutaminyl-peptide cyclotransferase n=1 Tax=Parasphingomonas puruogangriensis TaxID=3096155 RepID=UPI002FC5D8CC
MIARTLAVAALLLSCAGSSAQDAPSGSNTPPIVQPVIVASYPHDPQAFTEGLLITDGKLYESTGREGASHIRQIDLKTGKVLRQITLPPALFGEGIVAWGKELRSVVWHGGLGYRWSLPKLKQVGSFRYDGEGWAMTDDGHHIILSDGTPVLRFLDPKTMQVVRRLEVTYDGRPVRQLNELEYVNGEIFANIWMTPLIVRIDPATGRVAKMIDLSLLAKRVGVTDPDAVANGIAYDRAARKLYVTGKNWPTLFEITLPK